MNNPLRRLKQIPWTPLFWVSLLTLFWASVIDQMLRFGWIHSNLIRRAIELLRQDPLGVIISLAAAMGVGALAVVFLEILYPQMLINTGVLWALLLCLFLMLVVRGLLPLPTIFLNPSYSMLIGAMLGIFLKGKPYWR